MTPTTEGGAHVVVTLDSIYTLLLETRDTVRDMVQTTGELVTNSSDHEDRIRSLERQVWTAGGVGVLGGAGLGQLLGLFA